MKRLHYSVMSKEIISLFSDTDRTLFVDCTVGMGGHAGQILAAFPESNLFAVDVDGESIHRAREALKRFRERVTFFCFNFVELFRRIDFSNLEVSGLLVDPGLSSFQLKERERGFSHNLDAPLDMRKDRNSGITAEEVLNTWSEARIAEMIREFGELPRPDRLAKRIIEYRLFARINRTGTLKKIVEEVYGSRVKRGKSHPAAQVFQALRIVVNREFEGVREFIQQIPRHLNSGARVAFLTYHSVEDRLVKHLYRSLAEAGGLRIIKPFPLRPSEEEIEDNWPSRSAKLRMAEVV